MFRKYAAVIASVAMLSSTTMAFAGSTDDQAQPKQQQGALAPGNAAGVEKAEALSTNLVLITIGIGVVAGGAALALSNSSGNSTNGTH